MSRFLLQLAKKLSFLVIVSVLFMAGLFAGYILGYIDASERYSNYESTANIFSLEHWSR